MLLSLASVLGRFYVIVLIVLNRWSAFWWDVCNARGLLYLCGLSGLQKWFSWLLSIGCSGTEVHVTGIQATALMPAQLLVRAK